MHPVYVLHAVAQTGRTSEQIISRLTELGSRVATDPMPRPAPHDQLIVSRNLDGEAPWIDYDWPVEPAHIVRAA